MNRKVRQLLVLISLAFFAACSSGSEPAADKSQANFVLPPIKVVRTNLVGKDAVTGMPNRLDFTFEVCPLDIALAETVRSQNFIATGSQDGSVTLNSGPSGCIRITDHLDFSATDSENFCQRNYSVEGLAPYSGRHAISLGINPHRSGTAAIVDLVDEKTRARHIITRDCDSGKEPGILQQRKLPIALDWLFLELAGERHGADFSEGQYTVQAMPKFVLDAPDAVPMPITQGSFRLKISLYERVLTGAKTNFRKLAEPAEVEASVEAGVLRASFPMHFSTRLPQRQSDLLALIEIHPTHADSPFAASYFKSEFRGVEKKMDWQLQPLASNQSLQAANTLLDTDTDIDTDAERTNNFCRQDPHAFGFVVRNEPEIVFDPNDLVPLVRGERGGLFSDLASGKPVLVRADLKVCLEESGFSANPLTEHQLLVGFGEKNQVVPGQNVTTSGDGCARWSIEIPQAVFFSTDWLEQELVVQSAEPDFAGVVRRLPVFLKGNDTQFGRALDVRDCLWERPSRRYTMNRFVEQLASEVRAVEERAAGEQAPEEAELSREPNPSALAERDELFKGESSPGADNGGPLRTRRFGLQVPYVGIQKIDSNYQIDSDLNLFSHSRYQLSVEPLLDNGRDNALGVRQTHLNAGRIRVRSILALPIDISREAQELNLRENLYVLSASETTMEIRGDHLAVGDILTAHSWKDIPIASLRAYLIFEIQLLDEFADVAPFVGYAYFDTMTGVPANTRVRPVQNASDFKFPYLQNPNGSFEQVRELPRTAVAGTKLFQRKIPTLGANVSRRDAFAATIEIQPIAPDDTALRGPQLAELKSYIDNEVSSEKLPQGFVDYLCDRHFPPVDDSDTGSFIQDVLEFIGLGGSEVVDYELKKRGMVERFRAADCKANPKEFLYFKRLAFVKKVPEQVIHAVSQSVPYNFEVASVLQNDDAYARQTADTERFVRGLKNEVKSKMNGFFTVPSRRRNLNGNFGFENEFMLFAGLDWITAIANEDLTKANERHQASLYSTMIGTEQEFEFRADLEYCLYHRIKKHHEQRVRENDQGELICTDTVNEDVPVTESWFYLTRRINPAAENIFSGVILDQRAKAWSYIVRGKDRIDFVNSLFQEEATTILLRQNKSLLDVVEMRNQENDPEAIRKGAFEPERLSDGGFPGVLEY